MATLKERVDTHDREIAAIRKLVLTGMKMLTRLESRVDKLGDKIDRIADKVDRLADSQLKTDQLLQDLIRSLL